MAVRLGMLGGLRQPACDGGAVRVDGVACEPKTYNVDPAPLDGAVVQVGRRRFARFVSKEA